MDNSKTFTKSAYRDKKAVLWRNNGQILLSYREAAKLLNVSHNTVGRWFKELERRGFIVCMQLHLGSSGVGKTSHWRLTELTTPDGKAATNEFRKWKAPKTKSPIKIYTRCRQNNDTYP